MLLLPISGPDARDGGLESIIPASFFIILLSVRDKIVSVDEFQHLPPVRFLEKAINQLVWMF